MSLSDYSNQELAEELAERTHRDAMPHPEHPSSDLELGYYLVNGKMVMVVEGYSTTNYDMEMPYFARYDRLASVLDEIDWGDDAREDRC